METCIPDSTGHDLDATVISPRSVFFITWVNCTVEQGHKTTNQNINDKLTVEIVIVFYETAISVPPT